MPLNQLNDLDEYDRVTVKVKVVEIQATEIVGKGKQKQEVIIADATASAKLTLWEDVNTLELYHSYHFSRVLIRSFKGIRYLSLPTDGATIAEIDDIGDVLEGKLTAKLILETHNQDNYIHVRTYGKILTAIVGHDDVTNLSLLKAPIFTVHTIPTM